MAGRSKAWADWVPPQRPQPQPSLEQQVKLVAWALTQPGRKNQIAVSSQNISALKPQHL